jgi:hypothetical protein
MKIKLASLLILSALVTACGGSNSGSTNLPPPAPAPSTGTLTPILDNQSVQIFGEQEAQAGGAIGFALVPKNSLVVDAISWEQTNGPILTFLAGNSQTIGFDIPQSGNYSLRANVKMVGETATTSYNIDFSATTGEQKAAVRVDHTVTELGKVSLHLGAPEGKQVENVQWTQIGGPEAQNVVTDEDFLFFDAPSVTSDSVMAYRANVTYSDGSNDNDDVLLTVKNVNFDVNGLFYGNNTIITTDMHAYQENSPYKSALERCVYNNIIPNPPNCTFADLPLIGMQTNTPSINDILNRTLVSHSWMGERFAEFLQNSVSGPDMLNLLRGVTAIIISYDVRPSFYWSATGAIYLDANNFWQTPSERDTLNDQPDYRSDFGSDLQFSVFWRYTKDNDYYPKARIEKQNRIEKDFSDVEASISWLMYHELAHANDFFPPASWSSISTSTTPLTYFRNNGTNSDLLDDNFPLRSDEMHALAQVRFRNTTPTTTQKNYRGTDIEGFFVPDISASFYSYLTTREDFATLVERYMMLYRLDAEADVAIIDGTTQSDEPLVVWGQRNRISESSLEDRTVFSVTRVYPELVDVRTTLRNLSSPVLMRPNQGWFENIDISPIGSISNDSLSLEDKPAFKKLLTPTLMKQLILEDTRNIHQGKPKEIE